VTIGIGSYAENEFPPTIGHDRQRAAAGSFQHGYALRPGSQKGLGYKKPKPLKLLVAEEGYRQYHKLDELPPIWL